MIPIQVHVLLLLCFVWYFSLCLGARGNIQYSLMLGSEELEQHNDNIIDVNMMSDLLPPHPLSLFFSSPYLFACVNLVFSRLLLNNLFFVYIF